MKRFLPSTLSSAAAVLALFVALRAPVSAQTIAYDDFIQYKGEAGAKEAGKMRAEGKEYVVKDGDVLNFLFNV